MMRAIRGLCAATVVVALGCGDDATEPGLEGRWYADTGGTCGLILDLDAGEYESLVLCELTDGSVGVQTIAGSYATSGDRITFSPERSSCRDLESDTNAWALLNDGENLRLVVGEAVVILERVERTEGDGASGVVTLGCYDADGLFTPMAVAEQ
jgi:hypothetical protein